MAKSVGMRATRVAAALAIGVLGVTAGAAYAGPTPPPQSQEVGYRDATPDPTGLAIGSDGHCSGALPREAPHSFKAPARGTLKVTLAGFEGVWGLHLEDAKGSVLGDTDSTTGTPTLSVKAKKAGTVINIRPCNIAGSPDATITLLFTFG